MLREMGKSGGSRTSKQAEPQRSMRARAVSDLLPQVGGAAFRRFGFVQSAVVSRWREIVGERYAGVSSPESIRFPPGKRKDGVLTLVVEGAHAPMMQHVAPVIAERVNRFFGYTAVARELRRRRSARSRPTSEKAFVRSPIRSCARCWKRLRVAWGHAMRAHATGQQRSR
jgi:hypothetical protein